MSHWTPLGGSKDRPFGSSRASNTVANARCVTLPRTSLLATPAPWSKSEGANTNISACAPSSKLYCHEQWLAEDVRIKGCEALELHHLYRAMDFLEAHKEALEEGLYFRMADLLNLFHRGGVETTARLVRHQAVTMWTRPPVKLGAGSAHRAPSYRPCGQGVDKCAALDHPFPTLDALASTSSPPRQQSFMRKATSPPASASRTVPSSQEIRLRNIPVKSRGDPTS